MIRVVSWEFCMSTAIHRFTQYHCDSLVVTLTHIKFDQYEIKMGEGNLKWMLDKQFLILFNSIL